MHKGCLLQQYCSYGPSKACAGIHAASLLHTACKKKLAVQKRGYKANCKQIEGALRCSAVAAGAILDLKFFAGQGRFLSGRALLGP